MQEGEQWIGGEPSPPEQGALEFLWFRWETQSSQPCSECASRNGTSTPVRRPKHTHCRCTQEEDWRICFFQNRVYVSTSVETITVEAGFIEPQSSREFSRSESDGGNASLSFKGFSGGVNHSEGSGDKTTMSNTTDDTQWVYEKWERVTDTYIDNYDCKGSDENEQVEIKRIETKFLGFTRDDTTYTFTVEAPIAL